jgi:hypothetical protein
MYDISFCGKKGKITRWEWGRIRKTYIVYAKQLKENIV